MKKHITLLVLFVTFFAFSQKNAGSLATNDFKKVDYVYASRTTSQTTGIAIGSPILFTSSYGTIPNNNGVFTLYAGKTYSLQGCAGGSSGGGTGADRGIAVRWRDITNNILIGSEGSNLSALSNATNAISGGIASAIITPTSNITVRLEIVNFLGGNTPTQIGFIQDQPNSTPWGQIVQIGSSAIASHKPLSFTEAVTITATTTNPTKATTREADLINLVDDGSGWCDVSMIYRHSNSTGANVGNGSYIFNLPAGYKFDASVHPFYNGIIASIPSFALITTQIPGGIATAVNINAHQSFYIIPYSATQFRLAGGNGIQGTGLSVNKFVTDAYFGMNSTALAYLARFRFKKGI